MTFGLGFQALAQAASSSRKLSLDILGLEKDGGALYLKWRKRTFLWTRSIFEDEFQA